MTIKPTPQLKDNEISLSFKYCIQDSQEHGSNNEHMIARVYFSINDEEHECNVRQPFGENFSFIENPIEVEMPEKLKGIINYGDFRGAVEYYYKSLFTKSFGSGGTHTRMKNNRMDAPVNAVIRKADTKTGGW